MMKTQKLCECGCGKPTNIRTYSNKQKGYVRGTPSRFISGHAARGNRNGNWKGGVRYAEKGYKLVKNPEHPRADSIGYVREHIIIAEKVLGRPIFKPIVIHHYPKYPSDQLIICENDAYHKLLHQRQRAFKNCGHPSWRKCLYCHKYDNPINMMQASTGSRYHRECQNVYKRSRNLPNLLNISV